MTRTMLAVPLLCMLLLTGCAGFYQPAPERIHGLYYEQILDWQKRIQEKGWTRQDVDDVVNGSLKFVMYEPEEKDHWDTPQEFIQRGFRGDCEDIAIFMMATLRRLQYTRGIKILGVKTLLGDHAVLKVELPDGSWKMYETVRMPLHQVDQLFYRPIVEFDENTIVYYKSGSDRGDGLAR